MCSAAHDKVMIKFISLTVSVGTGLHSNPFYDVCCDVVFRVVFEPSHSYVIALIGHVVLLTPPAELLSPK